MRAPTQPLLRPPLTARLSSQRLEEMPPHATDSSAMLAIFLYPSEAHRLGVPSCMQYSLGADASQLLVEMYEQLVICSAGAPA